MCHCGSHLSQDGVTAVIKARFAGHVDVELAQIRTRAYALADHGVGEGCVNGENKCECA